MRDQHRGDSGEVRSVGGCSGVGQRDGDIFGGVDRNSAVGQLQRVGRRGAAFHDAWRTGQRNQNGFRIGGVVLDGSNAGVERIAGRPAGDRCGHGERFHRFGQRVVYDGSAQLNRGDSGSERC